MTCRFAGDGTPRLLNDHHLVECWDDGCRGCQPCAEAHCGTCGREHVAQVTCPGCVGKARVLLAEIGRMCSALPDEAEVKGVESEAMNLLGPACDVEARAHVTTSYLAGRLPEGWLEASHGKACPLLVNEACSGCGADDLHPLLVLGADLMEWQAELDHEDTSRITVAHAIWYLGANLTYMAQWPHVDFAATVQRWRDCASHIEAVIHDGEHVQRGAPCLRCGADLTRIHGETPDDDRWSCPRCLDEPNEQQYRLAIRTAYIKHAEWLPATECAERTGAPRSSITGWAAKGLVRRRRDSGRSVYSVADVQARMCGVAALGV